MSSVEEIYHREKPSRQDTISLVNKVTIYLTGIGASYAMKPTQADNLRIMTAIFLIGVAVLYSSAIAKINDTYTSFTSNNEFGMSNTEKAAARIGVKSTVKSILARVIVGGILHWKTGYTLPLTVTLLSSFVQMLSNVDIVDVLNRRGPKKPSSIPRSQSGRLI